MAKIDPKVLIGLGGLAALAFFAVGASEAQAQETEPDDGGDTGGDGKADTGGSGASGGGTSSGGSSSGGISTSGGLRKGKSSKYNRPWQRCLCAFYAATYGPDSVVNPSTEWDTGNFGELTKQRTIQFQKARGIQQDGVVGAGTNKAMDDWFSSQTGSYADGQAARKSVEGMSCPQIRQWYAAAKGIADLFG